LLLGMYEHDPAPRARDHSDAALLATT
jgi:hypothetical protein